MQNLRILECMLLTLSEWADVEFSVARNSARIHADDAV
jgi:hypothetical protein